MKIIIEFRDKDTEGNKVDNSQAEEKITELVKGFWNCEGIEINKGERKMESVRQKNGSVPSSSIKKSTAQMYRLWGNVKTYYSLSY